MNPTEELRTLRSSSSSQQLELEIGEKKQVRGIFDHGFLFFSQGGNQLEGFLSGGVVAGTSDSSVMHISSGWCGEFIQMWIYVALTIWIKDPLLTSQSGYPKSYTLNEARALCKVGRTPAISKYLVANHDNSTAFHQYLAKQGTEEAARKAGAKLKIET